jgi:O-antigen/teichoic acid export membrane protein
VYAGQHGRLVSDDSRAEPGAPTATHGLDSVVRGFGILAVASLLGQAIGFFALIYVAQRVGARGVGQYSFVLAVVGYAGLLANLGLDAPAVRSIVSGRASEGVTAEVLILKVSFASAAYLVLVATRSLWTSDAVERALVPVLGLNLLILALTLDWQAQAMRRFGAIGTWRMIGQVVYGLLVPVFVVAGAAGVLAYAWLNVVGLAVNMAGLAWVVSRRRWKRPVRPAWSRLSLRLRSGVPFLYALAMTQVQAGIGIVMLAYFRPPADVGIYAVANRLPSALVTLAGAWINAFFPHAASLANSDPKALLGQIGRVVTSMIVLGIGIAIGAALCAEDLMRWLFGAAFARAGAPTAVLAVAASVTLVAATFGNALLAAGFERIYARALTVALVVSIAANAALIPAAGALGAAIATLCGQLVIAAAFTTTVVRRLGRVTIDWTRLVRGLLAGAIMACCVLLTRGFGGGVPAATAILTFPVAAWYLGAIDPSLIRRGHS